MQVRLADDPDADSITALINVAFKAAEGFLIDRDRITLESVQSLLQTGKFLLVEADGNSGALAGCVYVELRGERAYLGLLSVDPSLQKGGLGSALMNAAEEYCVRTGCRFMDLQLINLREELPGFYRRRGYIENGIAPLTAGITPKLPCHFVKMSKTLA
jgi:GNAT superfamily N-acetyltransferase